MKETEGIELETEKRKSQRMKIPSLREYALFQHAM